MDEFSILCHSLRVCNLSLAMSPKEEKGYFLYGIGKAPDVLCLGNLVLKDYANPTNPLAHYTHAQLQ